MWYTSRIKEGFIPGTSIAVKTDRNEYINVNTVGAGIQRHRSPLRNTTDFTSRINHIIKS